ncbi:hypothetical protein MJO52_00795 [Microbulbifer variabilis]|uniref:SMODS and SLOG-associating 2TM effector domain-containing protein n=1 Tax=Microbulbifer variabilis TaxID=266805 RepID=A0ABY4VBQ3_9GAMM|nr:hypothetical protein [Microbulbifer variabilis]USD21712.1 hypothetical protein MJO52_00795 [Microbulbifer variabilis]
MDDKKRFEIYEKLYFHEVDAREKISSRLQIPLALLLSMTSVYALLIKGISLENSSLWNILFGFLLVISLVLFVTSISYFIKAFYGHTYEFIPSALDTENYRKVLIETYRDYPECDKLVEKYFNEYIFRYYNECSSANTSVNDRRSKNLHKCNTYLIFTVLPLSVAFLIFTLSGIDKNSVKKEIKVQISKPIEINQPKSPLKINGDLDFTTLEIDFSDDLKEIINDRKTKVIEPTTTSSTTTKENP